MLRARPDSQGFPVRNAPAGSAVNGAQGLITLDVFRSSFRVAVNRDRAELKVNPGSADSTTQRAVAGGGNFGLRRQSYLNRTAVAGAFVHGAFLIEYCVSSQLSEQLTFELAANDGTDAKPALAKM